MYFRQMWTDPRLVSPNRSVDIYGGQSYVDRVWIPDTFFPNTLFVRTLTHPTPNVFLRLTPKGEILYSQRYVK